MPISSSRLFALTRCYRTATGLLSHKLQSLTTQLQLFEKSNDPLDYTKFREMLFRYGSDPLWGLSNETALVVQEETHYKVTFAKNEAEKRYKARRAGALRAGTTAGSGPRAASGPSSPASPPKQPKLPPSPPLPFVEVDPPSPSAAQLFGQLSAQSSRDEIVADLSSEEFRQRILDVVAKDPNAKGNLDLG